MRVRDVMTEPAVSCGPADTCETAAGLMWDYDCGMLPVVEAGRVVGVLTDRDICMAAYTQGRLLADIPVGRAMAAPVVTCRPDDTVKHVEEMLVKHRIHRIPVVDEAGNLVGVLSLDDLARRWASEHQHRALTAGEVVGTMASIAEPRLPEGSES
jgi:CBS domain-containing protein